MIDQFTIGKIMDTAEITEVVQDFVVLKKRGVNYLGLCPFHNEKTPSFTVSPAKGIYKCFGCGRGGNSVNFIMEHEHVNYPDALKYLARKYNISVVEKELSEDEVQQKNERESLLVVLSYAQRYFAENLFSSDEGISIGLSYFKEREFRQDILKKFELGYSLEQKNAFTKSALAAGYKLEFLTKTGMTIANENYKMDRFHGRVIFPIHSLSGQVIGFGGRILKSDAKAAKYLNSPESDTYHKSRVLYGLYQAKKEIVAQDKCFLVEGYTDVLSLHQSGIENVVASSGTALTVEQIRLIKRFSSFVTIIFDGDEAGIKASLRGLDLVLEEGLFVKILMLPKGEDPDSYSKKLSSSDFLSFIEENEMDFIKFKTNLLVQDAKNDPIKKASLIRDIVGSIAVIPDSINRSVYLKECSNLLKVDEKVLYFETNKIRRKKAEHKYRRPSFREESPVQEERKPTPASDFSGDVDAQEREIIRLLLNYAKNELMSVQDENENEYIISVCEFIITDINNDELEFENPVYQQIIEEYTSHFKDDIIPDQKHFTHHNNKEISEVCAQLLAPSYDLSKIWRKHDNYVETEEMILKEIVPETLFAFKNKKVMEATMQLHQSLEEAQENDDIVKIEAIQSRIVYLNNLKKELSKNLGHRTII
ncbi:MAG: DNA primase [Bacteroidales bacterium]|nr:DNA primase [Bacteroidales bacterium]